MEGVAWCGVVWCGMALYGMVWCGVVWYVMVWYGVPRRAQCKGVPRAKACVPRQATRRHMHSDVGLEGVVWYGMVWCGLAWYGMVWYGMVWYGMVWYGVPRRAKGIGVPMVKAFQWPRRVWQDRQQGGACKADIAGERASKHGGWWERGLGQGLSAFLGKYVWILSEH